MKFAFFVAVQLFALPGYWSTANADNGSPDYELQIDFAAAQLKGLTLGDDALVDQLDNNDITIGFDLVYPLNDQFYVFFGGELFDENETVKTVSRRSSESGVELGGTGVGYVWGDKVEHQLEIGRIEYSDERQWWWDQYLDTIRLKIDAGKIEFMLASGRQQGRERSNDEFIDPQEKAVKRILANLHWHLADNQQLSFYYLSHHDESASYALNDSVVENRADESDANLRWFGLVYQGELAPDSIGDVDWRIGYTQLSGDEVVYELSDPAANIVTVVGIDRFDIDASAYEFSLEWQPVWVDDVKLMFSYAAGSGDTNLSDNKIGSFRQSGLHANETDYLYYGELYAPELSNIQIHSLGISLGIIDDLDIALLLHNYRQDEADTEMRDVSIDLDPNGLNRDLGSEIDLIAVYEIVDGLELEFIAAVFEAGDAYDVNAGRKSRYWSINLNYVF